MDPSVPSIVVIRRQGIGRDAHVQLMVGGVDTGTRLPHIVIDGPLPTSGSRVNEQRLLLGCNGSGRNEFCGELAEMLAFDAALSNPELDRVARILAKKFAVRWRLLPQKGELQQWMMEDAKEADTSLQLKLLDTPDSCLRALQCVVNIARTPEGRLELWRLGGESLSKQLVRSAPNYKITHSLGRNADASC